tara:strand:+ start:3393 stop:3914 length:522 start_codon:yes stop_codon:yes gene_type:complete
MNILSYRFFSELSFLLIPLLYLWNPSWLSLMGSQPYWPIFWLLPWSLLKGPFKGLVTGLLLGIVLDSLNNDLYTQIPGLMICGFWFGKIGNVKQQNLTRLQFGLIASLGTLICGLIYFVQITFKFIFERFGFWLFSYGMKNIFAQVFLTGLFAPVFCLWLFYLFSKKNSRIAN